MKLLSKIKTEVQILGFVQWLTLQPTLTLLQLLWPITGRPMSLNIYIFSSEEKDPMATLLDRVAELRADVASEKAEIQQVISSLTSKQDQLISQVTDLEAKLAEAIAALPNPDEVNAAIDALKADIANIYTAEPTPEPTPEPPVE